MAFAVPNHLPRAAFTGKDQSLGSTTKHYDSIIAKIAGTPLEELNSSRASSWVAELTKGIDETRASIHARIHENLPDFERQLQSSRDIVQRVHALETETDDLTASIYNQTTGLIPTISRRLSQHSILAQRAKDAEILHRATEHAFRCRDTLQQLAIVVSEARLAESTAISLELERLIKDAPEPLPHANVFIDIKQRFRVLHDNVQERLGHAYEKAVSFSSAVDEEKLLVSESVTVPSSSQQISLRDIFSTLEEESAKPLIATLRKNLLLRFLEPLIWSKASVTTDGNALIIRTHQVTHDPVAALSSAIDFIRRQLLIHIPSAYAALFAKELYTPLLSSLLNRLKHSIPSTLADLGPYILLVNASTTFEADLTRELTASSRQISEWASSLSLHYEKKRREEILQSVRDILVDESRLGGIRVNKAVPITIHSPDMSVSGESRANGTLSPIPAPLHSTPEPKPSATLAVTPAVDDITGADDEEDGWGLDEDGLDGDEQVTDPVTDPPVPSRSVEPEPHLNGNGTNGQVDEEAEAEDDPWAEEDPWGDDDDLDETFSTPSIISPTPSVVKSAKGLEKFSNKAKSSGAGDISSPPSASISFINGPGGGSVNRTLSPELPAALSPPSAPVQLSPPPPPRPATPVVETFVVSECAIAVLKLLEDTIDESKKLTQSRTFDSLSIPHSSSSSDRVLGDILSATTASILDLFRALTPIVQAEMMELSPALRIRFSNDCSHLSSEVERVVKLHSTSGAELSPKLKEAGATLAIVADQRFDAELEREKGEIQSILQKAQGFFNTGDDDRYEIDENIVDMVVETFLTLAPDWKGVLTPSAYLDAFSYLTEETLSSVLKDILALPDIPEVDSHRLNALCQKLDRLKELFILSPGEESQVGAYVPSWFKFAYISELLEASLADITYLFENGALIDFEREELVRLVQGLFSETPLRAKTIEKIRTLGLVPVDGAH